MNRSFDCLWPYVSLGRGHGSWGLGPAGGGRGLWRDCSGGVSLPAGAWQRVKLGLVWTCLGAKDTLWCHGPKTISSTEAPPTDPSVQLPLC